MVRPVEIQEYLASLTYDQRLLFLFPILMCTPFRTINLIGLFSAYRLTPVGALIMRPHSVKKNRGLPYFSGGYPLFFKVKLCRDYWRKIFCVWS
jgi:hypothetical protein